MKVALVTGVTSGFGLAIAKTLMAQGFHVVGTGRRLANLEALKAEFGDRFTPLNFDIRCLESVKSAFEGLPKALQQVDVLVNNAGLALGLDPVHEARFEDWQTMVETNINGLLYMTRVVLPTMVARNQGYIINIGSIAGNYPYPGGNVYGATKAFVKQFSLNLRADLAGKQIRVTNIEPGLCGDTDFSFVRFKGDDERASKLYENVAYVTPTDIANMVKWLIEQPVHVNVNRIEVMPTAQTFAPLNVAKDQ